MPDPAKPRILFVDDEPDLLAGLVRNLRSEHFEAVTASSGAEALEMLQNAGPFAVIVSDLRMPLMDGVTLLRKAHELAPDTVRVLFTGHPDIERSIAAINEGAIFRFLTKPCSRVSLALTMKAAVEQHRLITAERVLLQQTVHGSVKALADILALTAPMAFGRAARLRQIVRALSAACAVPESWHVEVAAMLSQVGGVILPPLTLEKLYQGEPLNVEEQTMAERMPEIAEQILANIPRLEPVREVLRLQKKRFDGASPPAGPGGAAIPWGARALKLALDLDVLESAGTPSSRVFGVLRERQGWYDPDLLAHLEAIRQGEQSAQEREIPLAGLLPGMVLAEDVRTAGGELFLARGQEVTPSLLERLRNFGATGLQTEAVCRIRPDGGHAAPLGPAITLEEPDQDPTTGLPGKTQAARFLQSLADSDEPCHAVVLVLDRLAAVGARFGRKAADDLLCAFGRYIAHILNPRDRLFRWTGPALVALKPGVEDMDSVGNYFRVRLEQHSFQHLIRTSSHSIPVCAPPQWAVLPALAPPDAVCARIDLLLESLTKGEEPGGN